MSDMVGNPKDRFSRVEAHMIHVPVYYIANKLYQLFLSL